MAISLQARPHQAGAWQRFLHSHYAPLLTHSSLAVLTAALFIILLTVPFWLAFFPSALIAHRIGVMLHEYIHGIPFRSYQHNVWVLSFYDGVLLLFGMMHLFGGTHLAHHHWLNTDKEPQMQSPKAQRTQSRLLKWVSVLELVMHLKFLVESFQGKHPYVRLRRFVLGAGLTLFWILFWVQVGHSEVVWKLWAVAIYTVLIPVSLRGAVEHHSYPGDPGFANEYKAMIPLFNLNRHIHHHEEPYLPWYLLKFRTRTPHPVWHYYTHWFRVYVKRDLVLMKPMPTDRRARPSDSRHKVSGSS